MTGLGRSQSHDLRGRRRTTFLPSCEKLEARLLLVADTVGFVDSGPIVVSEQSGWNEQLQIAASGIPDRDVSVSYTVSGTAILGRDYYIAPNPIVIPAGLDPSVVPIKLFLLNDQLSGPEYKTLQITLTCSEGAHVGPKNTALMLIQDESPLPSLGASAVTTIPEGASGVMTTIEIPVYLSAPSELPISIQYVATANYASGANAVPGINFVPRVGVLSYPPGMTAALMPVTVIGDSISDPMLSFTIQFRSDPIGITGVATSGIIIQILGNPQPTLSASDVTGVVSTADATMISVPVHLSHPTGEPVSVSYQIKNRHLSQGKRSTPKIGVIKIEPGQVLATIPVLVPGGSQRRDARKFVVALLEPVGVVLKKASVVVTIVPRSRRPASQPVHRVRSG